MCRRPLNPGASSQNGACAVLGIIATSACGRLALCWSTTEGLTIGSRPIWADALVEYRTLICSDPQIVPQRLKIDE